eukprot:scaffold3767_cov114-Isochrysis_galbana.AAC.45
MASAWTTGGGSRAHSGAAPFAERRLTLAPGAPSLSWVSDGSGRHDSSAYRYMSPRTLLYTSPWTSLCTAASEVERGSGGSDADRVAYGAMAAEAHTEA